MTSATPSLLSPVAPASERPRSAFAELSQETLALTRRLFLQLARRPSTLVAGVLPAVAAWLGQLIVDAVVAAMAAHRGGLHGLRKLR